MQLVCEPNTDSFLRCRMRPSKYVCSVYFIEESTQLHIVRSRNTVINGIRPQGTSGLTVCEHRHILHLCLSCYVRRVFINRIYWISYIWKICHIILRPLSLRPASLLCLSLNWIPLHQQSFARRQIVYLDVAILIVDLIG